MAIKTKDLKVLWARSGNRCAICRTPLTQNSTSGASHTLGEQAHIVGDNNGSARSDSVLSDAERDEYHNLILLCPNHHTEIDRNIEDWPAERLYIAKSKHELWVTETLSETENYINNAKQAAAAAIIDSAVELCKLEEWKNWTSFALSPDPKWHVDMPDKIFEFRLAAKSSTCSESFDELGRATETFSILLNTAAQKFMQHAEKVGDQYFPHKFYRSSEWDENYDNRVRSYLNWVDDCHSLIREATRAANWFAEVVRRDINPMFFAEKGKFLVIEGPDMQFQFTAHLLEYSDEDKRSLPSNLEERLTSLLAHQD